MRHTFRSCKIALVAVVITTLAGCDYLQDMIPEPDLAQKRANEYLQGTSVPLLQPPPGVTLVQPNQYYLINSTTKPDNDAMAMALPPGSNVAQEEQTLPERIALAKQAPITYTFSLTTVSKATAIKVNQNFENTWEAAALALQAGGYIVDGEDNSNGNFTFESKPDAPVMGRFVLHTAIHGNWKHGVTTVSLLYTTGAPVEEKVAKPIMKGLLKNFEQVATVPHPSTQAPHVTITTNERSVPILLMDRDLSVAYAAIGKALKAAGYTIVKADTKRSAYYFVDTVSSRGVITSKMELYGLYVRSNGVIARAILLNEDRTFAPAKVAMPILISTGKQIIIQQGGK